MLQRCGAWDCWPSIPWRSETRKTAGEDTAILRTRDLCSVQDLEKESWESLGIEVRNKNNSQKTGTKKHPVHSSKLTWLAGKSPSSIQVHFAASHVRFLLEEKLIDGHFVYHFVVTKLHQGGP